MLQTAALNAGLDPMQESNHEGVMISALTALANILGTLLLFDTLPFTHLFQPLNGLCNG
jgi:hypothetical protein